MAMELFTEVQTGMISQASFELGRLYAQEDIFNQYHRCQKIGLSEIDFRKQKREWQKELDAGIYKFTFKGVGNTYFVKLERHQVIREWMDDSVNFASNQPEMPLFIRAPSTPISPATQTTEDEYQLSQSVSVVTLNDDYESDESDGYYPMEDPTIPEGKVCRSVKLISDEYKPIKVEPCDECRSVKQEHGVKVKFEDQSFDELPAYEEACKKVKFEAPGAYPWPNQASASASALGQSSGASNVTRLGPCKPPVGGYVKQKPGYNSGLAASFTWSENQSGLPVEYDRRVPKGSVTEPSAEARLFALKDMRSVKVEEFINQEMGLAEHNYWHNWAGAKEHPFRSIPDEPNKSRMGLGLWPFYVNRTPHLSLYHMCRHKDGVSIPELMAVRLFSVERGQNLIIWLPRTCGPGSQLHDILVRTGHISIRCLAQACGFHQTSELSKGLMVFIFNLCFGNIRYHELYYGQCTHCGTYYCHLDKRADHPCQNSEQRLQTALKNQASDYFE